ncbi:MAG: sulfatase-like hydrolase/transferase [Chitinivibrionales bacterium]|nr:sulfatase-like hydrolase/transferase [Chitinivibrionales bacterium]
MPLQSSPPNIVLIFTDDQGYGDLSCYGSTTINTPKIDRMAEEGVKFTDFLVTRSVCTPSRAALMTGSYACRVGINCVFPSNSEEGLHPDEITIADILKQKNYATACIGKWHLGHLPHFLPALFRIVGLVSNTPSNLFCDGFKTLSRSSSLLSIKAPLPSDLLQPWDLPFPFFL